MYQCQYLSLPNIMRWLPHSTRHSPTLTDSYARTCPDKSDARACWGEREQNWLSLGWKEPLTQK
jgi:hypothetical protein